jgi:hypothetical protein
MKKPPKYAHLTVEVRLVAHGIQVDMFDRTLSTPDGQGIIHRTELWDFADDSPSMLLVTSAGESPSGTDTSPWGPENSSRLFTPLERTPTIPFPARVGPRAEKFLPRKMR